jgi:SAM-dependent methyltransferase
MGLLGTLKGRLPDSFRKRLVRWRRPRWWYVLRRAGKPISDYAGRERGNPIDRLYIETFLAEHAPDVRGRCLEVKDDLYTRRFGGQNVTRADVLDVNTDNKAANVFGDLRHLAAVIADDTYDCFILTQTLQYIDDLDAAVRECRRILKPGGVLLVTLPCLGKVEGLEHNVSGNFWRFTPHAARYLFHRHFGEPNCRIQTWGNVLAGMAFWVGMAQEDLPARRLTEHDPAFPVIVTVRAVKAPALTAS